LFTKFSYCGTIFYIIYMRKFFIMMRSTLFKNCFIIILFQFLLSSFALSQNITVYGQVKDIFNRIIMGASVKVQRGTTEVFTDSMGNYQITVPQKGKLIFSQSGFLTQKIAVKGKKNIDVSFNLDLNRTTNKPQSSSSVDEKMLEHNKEVSIAQLLLTIPGIKIVYESGEMKLLIRGTRSLNGDNYALIVLNGSPYYGSIDDIDRNNIESIEVLKDPSSTTAWGLRGANGVVLISTKVKK
jgi:TonB-dependent SusC/RagA subfamily outer membrane receptor